MKSNSYYGDVISNNTIQTSPTNFVFLKAYLKTNANTFLTGYTQ